LSKNRNKGQEGFQRTDCKSGSFFKADEKRLLVLFLSDSIVSEAQDKILASEALQAVEKQINFIKRKKH